MSELETLCAAYNVRADFRYGQAKGENEWGYHNWRVTLRKGRKQLTVDFFTGEAITDPTVADVLNCLLLDARIGNETFEDFCDDFGYDNDSRKAYASWQDCVKMGQKLPRFLGDDFDTFANAKH